MLFNNQCLTHGTDCILGALQNILGLIKTTLQNVSAPMTVQEAEITSGNEDSVVIEIEAEVLGQKKLIDNLTGLSEALKEFLLNIIETASKSGRILPSGNILVTRSQVLELIKQTKLDQQKKVRGVSTPLFSRRIKELEAIKVNHTTVCEGATHYKKQSQSRYVHYLLKDMTPLVALPPLIKKAPASRRTKTVIGIQKQLLKESTDLIYLNTDAQLDVFLHQQLFNGILDAAMRLSHKDERKVIKVIYPIKNEEIVIEATCSTAENSGIAMLTDQRAMRPLMAYCKKEVVARREKLKSMHGDHYSPSMVPNHFQIDIHELCVLMDLKVVSANIESAVAMMHRLADTNYQVDASASPWFKRNFSLLWQVNDKESDIFNLRFIHNLDIAKDHTELEDLFGKRLGEMKPRYYKFSLEPRLFYSMVIDDNSTLFISHKDLSKENSGIIQRFYNWAKYWVGVREKFGMPNKWYSIHELHAMLTPAARLDNFVTNFKAGIEKHKIRDITEDLPENVEKSTISLVYGYYVYYECRDNGDYFRFERNREDPLVGDNSTHNIRTRNNLLNDASIIEVEHE